jgi:membrane-bound inhibitor of C-type lysozyme
MEILNFDSNGSNRSPKKRGRIATIIGGAFLFAAIGSTFAANITINTTDSLEYGQGLTQAVACESTLIVTPVNRFINSAGGGAFYLETITVTDSETVSNSTGLSKCIGKKIKISVFGNTGTAQTFGSVTSCTVPVTAYSASGAGYTHGITTTGLSCTGLVAAPVSGGLSIATTSLPALDAGNVYKIAIESIN